MLGGDLKNVRLIYLKGGLFVLCGSMASVLILCEHPDIRTAALLALAIWCFARAYYFAFYVIQHYVDDTYRFAGLGSFLLHMLRRYKKQPPCDRDAGQ